MRQKIEKLKENQKYAQKTIKPKLMNNYNRTNPNKYKKMIKEQRIANNNDDGFVKVID